MFVNARALFDGGTPNEAYAADLLAQPPLTRRDVLLGHDQRRATSSFDGKTERSHPEGGRYHHPQRT
jgi:hypothetical protein